MKLESKIAEKKMHFINYNPKNKKTIAKTRYTFLKLYCIYEKNKIVDILKSDTTGLNIILIEQIGSKIENQTKEYLCVYYPVRLDVLLKNNKIPEYDLAKIFYNNYKNN